MNRHADTLPRREDLGTTIPAYQPTHDFPGPYIDAAQRALTETALQDGYLIQLRNRRWLGKVIPGWLRREDALKLYELAYFATGDILELGCYQGLSTSILARAVRSSKRGRHIFTVDLDPAFVRASRSNLGWLGLRRGVTVICGDALAVTRDFAAQGKRFGFVFIDHSHAYEPVRDVCRELGNVVAAGGFCLFHDFNDSRNNDPDEEDYGVYQAVQDGLDPARFEFYGIYGCTGLYRAIK